MVFIGGGAGTGIRAKCEEAGGIDLIVIYNSGRYRMAGRGSLAGLMPYGDANAIVVEMAAEVLPVVKKTPVLAGVNGTDPFCIFDHYLDQVKAVGFAGVQNFPTVGLFDGTMRANLEETNMGYQREVEMIHLAQDVKRNHKEDIINCLSAYHLLPSPTTGQQDKAEKLRDRIERMGDVNPHAEEAYDELVERYEFLSTQSQDLTESLEKLQKVIQKINRTSRKRFREAFDAVNEKFQQTFPRMFRGGKASAAASEPMPLVMEKMRNTVSRSASSAG